MPAVTNFKKIGKTNDIFKVCPTYVRKEIMEPTNGAQMKPITLFEHCDTRYGYQPALRCLKTST